MEKGSGIPQYSYYVRWSPEDREFVATFLELPELSGLGSTIPEAIHELKEALIGWLETAEEKRFDLPEPLQENAPSPLVILDRSLVGRDALLIDLQHILPEEIAQRAELATEEKTHCATIAVKVGEVVISSPAFDVALG